MRNFRFIRSLLLIAPLAAATCGGCLWNQTPPPVAPSLKEKPSNSQSTFGRKLDSLGQMGIDPRTRAIEESLGVGN